MTNEQREAIEMYRNLQISDDVEFENARNTILSIIKEQEEKIETTTTNYKNLIVDVSSIAKELGLEEDATIDEIYTAIRILKSKRINVIEQLDCIEKKDKQIDLMANSILTREIGKNSCQFNKTCTKFEKGRDIHCKDCIKQYFAGLVEKE